MDMQLFTILKYMFAHFKQPNRTLVLVSRIFVFKNNSCPETLYNIGFNLANAPLFADATVYILPNSNNTQALGLLN